MTSFKLITAANDSYILTLLDFIQSFILLNIDASVLTVYDLGLNVNSGHYRELLKLHEHNNFIFKKFDYSLYPEHVDLTKFNGLYCSYAFKPIIIYNEANCVENSGKVLFWMDAANRFDVNSLNQMYRYVKQYGIYSPISNGAGSIEAVELNHPATIALFGVSEYQHKNLLASISANLIGIDYSMTAGKNVMDELYDKSLLKEFIIPVGSSRNNHRQDQSLLSIIMYLYEKNNNITFSKHSFHGITFWNKKDAPVMQSGVVPFKLMDKVSGKQLAIIYCKTLEEAIETYANRKLLTIEVFLNFFLVKN